MWFCILYDNIFQYQYTWEPICFKLSMMLDAARLFDSSVDDLDIHPRSQVIEKLELVHSSVVKLREATQMLVMVDFVREMTVKKSFGQIWIVWAFDLLVLFC